jgi:hypothetical protein
MNRIKKIKWTFRIILISFIGVLILQKIIVNSRFNSHFDNPENRNEAWSQDLSHFQENYFRVCKSFPKDSMFKANQIIDSIKQNIGRFSDNKIQLLISMCVSMADDAHTSVYFGKFKRIPLRLYLFDDGLYVIKAKKGYEQYLGFRVNKICNKTIDELIDILDIYVWQ